MVAKKKTIAAEKISALDLFASTSAIYLASDTRYPSLSIVS